MIVPRGGAFAQGLDLRFPVPAKETARIVEPDRRIALPAGPLGPGGVPREIVEGRVDRMAWRVDGRESAMSAVFAALREQIEDAGYDAVFECATEECGGFDFRFAVQTLDAPDMYVDLSDYLYLLARRGARYAGLMVSRAHESIFVQITLAAPSSRETDAERPPDVPPEAGSEEGRRIWQALAADGRAVLDDVVFGSGSATLGGAGAASLLALAEALAARPELDVTIVGHTDATGGLAANVALSTRRARAVRQTLIDEYGVDPARLGAEGVGYLAPRASNGTEEGRSANRRVEVVLPE